MQADAATPVFDFEAVFEPDDYMYFYRDWVTDEVTDRQVEFLVKELALDGPSRILDLACGFGRHANRLAARGHAVTGIELTPGFLDLARRDAQERGVHVDYRQGDMRELDIEGEFDCVLLLFTAFGYFDDETNVDVLRRVARALRPGGRFCMDINNRDAFARQYQPDHIKEKGTNCQMDLTRFDSVEGRLVVRRIVWRDGQRREKPFFIRLYNPTELRDALARAGLRVEAFYGDWEGAPASLEKFRQIVVARK